MANNEQTRRVRNRNRTLRTVEKMAKKKEFWVYSHDSEGELISNIVHDEPSFNNAVDAAVHWLRDAYPGQTGVTVRVVDNETSNTVWIAGPGNQIKSLEQALLDER